MISSVIPAHPVLNGSVEGQECFPDNPFDRYPWGASGHRSEGLLSHGGVQRWFDVIEWGRRNDLYTVQQALERKSGPRVQIGGQELLMISSYDYLGLIGHPQVEEAAIEAVRKYGTGTGGVRLLTGTIDLHRELESELAGFKGTEAALTFTSGYMANLGVIASLLGPGDRVVLDSRSHRSVIDACRLARVPIQSFAHNDVCSLQKMLGKDSPGRRTLIAVEGVYSMDGDICPLPDVVALKKRYGAYLMVDEAHSFGTLGLTGRGVDQFFGVPTADVDIWMGSLSKAVPANGGFIAGSRDLIIYLQHGAAPFMFSAALCPAAAAAALEALRVLQREPERVRRLHRNANVLRSGLMDLGYDTGRSASPVIPVMTGSEAAACRLARELFRIGIAATPVLHPAVPPGEARLRLCATAAQDEPFFHEVLKGFESPRFRFSRPSENVSK